MWYYKTYKTLAFVWKRAHLKSFDYWIRLRLLIARQFSWNFWKVPSYSESNTYLTLTLKFIDINIPRTLRTQNILRQISQCTKQTSFSLRYRISIKHVPILIQLHVQLNPETCSTWPSLIYVRSTSLWQIMVLNGPLRTPDLPHINH